MILRICLMLVLIQPIAGLMCYFCEDSSNEGGKNQCQTWHRTMRYYRKKAEKTGSYTTEKYVKNCTDYGSSTQKYCMIASVEERKNLRSFIRDCSDGSSFFSDDINSQFQGDFIRPDNQTTCRYTGQGYLACVTICGNEYGFGHFCNGPLSSVPALQASVFLILTLIVITNRYFY